MAAYSTQTVAQLKEILKTRGLSTAGVKSELISRLEENDAASTTTEAKPEEELLDIEEEEKPETTTAPAVETETETKTETEAVAAVEETPIAATTEEPKEEEKKVKELTSEERKAAALELLNKKLKRAIKFGTDTEDLKKQIDRVEKFGVEIGTSLAKEIGFASNDKGLSERKHFRGRGRRFSHGRR